MPESIHEKLKRVRKPRVHITYDVETEGAQVLRELPFVVGVLGGLSGDNSPEPNLRQRKFVEINRDNFNTVMAGMTPGLKLRVDNTLQDGGQKEMAVEVQFSSMEDFEPASIVKQVPALKKLFEARNKLRDLMSKADSSQELESILETVLQNTENLNRLAGDLATTKDDRKPAKGDKL